MKLSLHTFLAATLFPMCVQAATLVEMKVPDGMTRIWSEGHRSRMDMSGDRGFMLLNSKDQTLYVVMPERRTVMDISNSLRQAQVTGSVAPTYTRDGKGPDIAGYPTVRYRFSANGTRCGSVLASSKARDDANLDELFVTMDRLAAQAQSMAEPFMQQQDPCVQAEMQISGTISKIGVPLQVSGADGTVASEVVRIDPAASLPANAFVLPADYEVQNMGMMMEQAKKMQQMMQQMSPETRQQMQKLMQQYQQ